ncbi:glycosyltransferase [Pinibacter aurantiacus]|uniref:Glycosyltransferase n=1 Tax=Pinibacter aurantiacus TaxID=2851599 RepID=A0A9E2SBP9_9BACT|nr:glycosyltransferase [Pinibacter aurantiacus]MBV4356980.1 glycosyltransferase [Pinibacter aurantiacus]
MEIFLSKSGWQLVIFGLFCVISLIQLIYILRLFGKLAFYKTPSKEHMQQHPVSVIVCARDEAGNLTRNLPGILVQKYPSTNEVIVVNHNSQDETRFLLDEFKKTFKNLYAVNLENDALGIPGKKYPLSIGIKEAKYEVLLLTDADCVPASEDWIEHMQDGYDKGTEIVIGYGAYFKRPGFLNKLIRFETFHAALQYLSYAIAGMPYMGVGRNLSYKKNLFLRNKGFSFTNHLPGGDDDLFINKVATKTNTRVVIHPDSFTLSEPKRSFGDWMRQKNRHFSTAKYYKPKHKFLLGLYTASQFLFYPLFIATLIFFDWRLALGIFALRFISQGFIYYKAMKQLNEKDLWPLWWLFDLWMFLFYCIFAPALWKKPKTSWN